MANWGIEFAKVEQCSQRQDGLLFQLEDLVKIANKFGFYDAADYLTRITESKPDKFIIFKDR
jgi:hypothetical protein